MHQLRICWLAGFMHQVHTLDIRSAGATGRDVVQLLNGERRQW